MPLRTLLLMLVLGATAIFVALNWSAFTTPTSLSLGYTTITAPLGMIMLGLLTLTTFLFLVFVVYLETAVLISMRRQARDLSIERERADAAEASRFTDLHRFLESELAKIGGQGVESHAAVMTRLESMEGAVRSTVEEAGNTLAAYVGELEERLGLRGEAK